MEQHTTDIELLNRDTQKKYAHAFALNEALLTLPEKVIQFGTGILLRGLVDYLIDKANKNDFFNGRVVVVKSTGNNVDEFTRQDNFYTILEKGVYNGSPFEKKDIITSISRVLPAEEQWPAVLQCAADPALEIIISNTTEAGLVFRPETLSNESPQTFPAKLTAYLWQRYKAFDGDKKKGMVILPTELVSGNGDLLKQFVVQHAFDNMLPAAFIGWLNESNHFCNTLVDRIVPGKSEKEDIINWDNDVKYIDHLHTTVEPYLLWAIEGGDAVKEKLSFTQADNRVVIAESIEGFKEQKLRILNGSNTTVVTPAYLSGLNTVYDTVTDPVFGPFTRQLIELEIIPTIIEDCPDARIFAKDVMDRFHNSFIRYPLLNVALQCSSKMNSRNAATISRYYQRFNNYPPLMSIGLAAFFLFYTPAEKEDETYYGKRNNERYAYRDEHAEFLCATLEGVNWKDARGAEAAVSIILNNDKIFSPGLASLPAIAAMLVKLCAQLMNEGIKKTIEQYLKR